MISTLKRGPNKHKRLSPQHFNLIFNLIYIYINKICLFYLVIIPVIIICRAYLILLYLWSTATLICRISLSILFHHVQHPGQIMVSSLLNAVALITGRRSNRFCFVTLTLPARIIMSLDVVWPDSLWSI